MSSVKPVRKFTRAEKILSGSAFTLMAVGMLALICAGVFLLLTVMFGAVSGWLLWSGALLGVGLACMLTGEWCMQRIAPYAAVML